MFVQHAKAAARHWVIEEASSLTGFHGAYFAGSANWLPVEAPLPAWSDLDINIVFTGPNAPSQRRKIVYKSVLLEATALPLEQFQSPDLILGDYHLAGESRTPSIILGPSGQLIECFHEDLLGQIGRILIALGSSAEVAIEAAGVPYAQLFKGVRLSVLYGSYQSSFITVRPPRPLARPGGAIHRGYSRSALASGSPHRCSTRRQSR